MWLFGAVWSTPEECHRLADLIEAGLDSGLAIETRRMYLVKLSEGKYTACVQTLALIGLRRHIGSVQVDLNNYEGDKTQVISRVTDIGEEILKRTTCWHSVDQLSAREIIKRLRSVS